MSATALVTRPREDAEGIAAALESQGFEVAVEPLLNIVIRQDPALSLDGVQAILATSANGVRALAANLGERRLPLYAVGEATARTAREHGFAEVDSAGGDVASLAALVTRRCRPQAGTLLHAAGSKLAGDLAGQLAGRGFTVRRAVLYEAETASTLSDALCRRLAGEGLDLALFFSPRTAATFVTLTLAANLGAACRRIIAYGLSAAVGGALAGLPWQAVRTADRPDQAALLEAIGRDFSGGNRL
ncbi:MAG TPA: uroporphyrinogen-III synthase [Rhodospirillaceae bacterium]|nr:uroporphyrinogen-III synthase [Rhodospirillaceae bacterium]